MAEPEFTGMDWYEDYGERHADDLDEGRIVALFRFEEAWTSWEMHPAGEEVVCCIQGHMTLHQELPDGQAVARARPGRICDQSAREPGTRPTLTSRSSPCSSLPGKGTKPAALNSSRNVTSLHRH